MNAGAGDRAALTGRSAAKAGPNENSAPTAAAASPSRFLFIQRSNRQKLQFNPMHRTDSASGSLSLQGNTAELADFQLLTAAPVGDALPCSGLHFPNSGRTCGTDPVLTSPPAAWPCQLRRGSRLDEAPGPAANARYLR